MFDVQKYENDIINNLCEIIKFESVSEESENSDAPFGENCKEVLNYTLNLASSLGFKTKNVDGYCGYIEFGEGEEMLGIIGHLDVVPAKMEDGWITDPFEPTIRDGKIYGRGAIDDKGPVIASLYAMKMVMDNFNIKKRVRLILGLNEEKDWKCINYYKLNEEAPTLGFSPDAEFPCIYAEKGIFNGEVKGFLYLGDDVRVVDANCLNNAINVVPKYASITLEYYSEDAKNRFMNLPNITTTIIDEKTLKLEALGISAHAAYPEQGDNAIAKLLLNLPENDLIRILRENGFFEISSPKYLGGESTIDESGVLTSNIARIKYLNDKIVFEINYRVPVNTEFEKVKSGIDGLKEYIDNLEVNLYNVNPKLYVPKDSYLVKTLTNIFEEETGMNAEPIATGGGTYARAFDNCVAFGAIMPGEEETYHKANEFINIENLMKSTKIYARAIYELTK